MHAYFEDHVNECHILEYVWRTLILCLLWLEMLSVTVLQETEQPRQGWVVGMVTYRAFMENIPDQDCATKTSFT